MTSTLDDLDQLKALEQLPEPFRTQVNAAVPSSAQAVAARHDLHSHPELGFEEHRTAEIVASLLESWGIEVQRNVARTGVVGILKRGTSERAIGLRADMDALPITELNSFAHASRITGTMHACGHDGHTAMLLMAAKYLSEEVAFDGTVYFIFQPAEEGRGGAQALLEDGIFRRFQMDAIFGMHNWPGLEVGKFAINKGAMFASNHEFAITVRGRGGHGAMPHLTIDPVPIACQIVQALQTIVSRNISPTDAAVVSVTTIHAGDTVNVIPSECVLKGTVRAFRSEVAEIVKARMSETILAIGSAFGSQCALEYRTLSPATTNHPAEAEFVHTLLSALVGNENIVAFEGSMGSEDFSYLLSEKRGCYFLIGNGDIGSKSDRSMCSASLHSPHYDFNDALVPIGGMVWVNLAKCWLDRN